ncbi:RhtB family transporter [Actinomadura sp. NBRC 104412]|uniref:LysE family translocator n=1 Tax=Actinomadura sp. NBRC 104412 TaxID=3032203 RepID=UPI0024A0B905|nr:LysE family translocator [Actinomadura sp. NBRC 104412]GLZ08305.1 RhtB family transporter [Actinomadura sp. NBRC 104412]
MTHPLPFLLAATALIAIPGPNHLYIAARAAADGRRAGLASAMGVETGTLVHVAAAAAGLSALVAASAAAFGALRYAGAAYLIYLAIRTWRDSADRDDPVPAPKPLGRVYLDGLLVNLFNPKVVLFFLAFLPQFVDQEAGAVPAQIVVMGLVTGLIGLVSDVLYAVAGGAIGSRLRARPLFRRRQRYATGAIYLGLGAATALTGPGPRRL